MSVARKIERDLGKKSAAGDPLARFSRGEIGRKQAMRALDVSYGQLLDMLAERKLPLPEMPKQDIDRMANELVRLLEKAR